jgi:hypothetical protein
MDKDITAADAAQEDEVNTVIEKGDGFSWEEIIAGKK